MHDREARLVTRIDDLFRSMRMEVHLRFHTQHHRRITAFGERQRFEEVTDSVDRIVRAGRHTRSRPNA